MNLNHNELPDVNDYIKQNNLTPCFEEQVCGSRYNPFQDLTYLVKYEDNTYISFCFKHSAIQVANENNGTIVLCKGEIK